MRRLTQIADINRQIRINLVCALKSVAARPFHRLAVIIVICIVVAVAFALTPANGGFVGGIMVTVDNTDGDQLDPAVSSNIAVYTNHSGTNPGIRYFDFLTSQSASVPGSPGANDTLPNVDGAFISFSRQHPDGSRTCMVFDVAALTLTEIGPPGSGGEVFATAIGGDTVAFTDAAAGNGDIKVGRISSPTIPPVNISSSVELDANPAVSPDGAAVVWQGCAGSFSNCGIFKSTFAGVWSSPQVVADTASNEANPDTDGVHVVYDSNRPSSTGGPDIYFQTLSGGPETQLGVNGLQRNPSISRGVIAFESIEVGALFADVFVYVIATNTLWRVTDTPAVHESLSDITVLANGDIRVVWTAHDGAFGEGNIYARTFTIPLGSDTTAPSVTIISPADGATYSKGQPVIADFNCEDEPDGSGLASCTGTVANNSLIDTANVGSHSFSVTGTDNEGNSATVTTTYNVAYSFSGFLQPVENLPALNIATAGSAIPVKFSLGGNQGLGIFAAGYPVSSLIPCAASEPGVVIEQTVTAGNSSLSYNAGTDQYSYIWKTERSWKGTCRIFVVRLNDNSEHLAKFRFR